MITANTYLYSENLLYIRVYYTLLGFMQIIISILKIFKFLTKQNELRFFVKHLFLVTRLHIILRLYSKQFTFSFILFFSILYLASIKTLPCF